MNILILEEDSYLCGVLKDTVEGFVLDIGSVHACTDNDEALRILAAPENAIGIVVVDIDRYRQENPEGVLDRINGVRDGLPIELRPILYVIGQSSQKQKMDAGSCRKYGVERMFDKASDVADLITEIRNRASRR